MGSDELDIHLLGRFAVLRDGEEIPTAAFGGRLSRRLLRYLVCRDGDLVPHDILVDVLWGDDPPADPAANLKVLVNRARRVVGAAILSGPGGYRFDPTVCEVDARRFLDAVDIGSAALREGDHDAATVAFDAAISAWSGEPLPEDLYEPWAEGPRRRLGDAYLRALESSADAALSRGDDARAVELAALACDRERLRERAHLLLARGLAAVGDRARALQVVRGIIDRTAAELGLDPSPAVARLQTELLTDGAPTTDAQTPTAALAVGRRGGQPSTLPYVVRGDDLPHAQHAVTAEPPHPVVVAGAPGTGKTRLLEEVAAWHTRPLLVRAHLAERDQDGSLLRDVLRGVTGTDGHVVDGLHPQVRDGLATLVPEFGPTRRLPTPDPPSLRSLVTEGTVALLAAVTAAGGLLIIDDVQWADPTSLEVLAAAIARLPDLAVLVSHRSRGTGSDEPVDRFLAQLHAGTAPVCSIRLGVFSRDALAVVVAAPLPRLIADHTDSSPFTVTQVVAAWRAADLVDERDGRLALRPDTEEAELVAVARASHERSVRTRVNRHAGHRREVLELIALLGRDAPARLLADACGRPIGEVHRDLDELTRTGLLVTGPRGWTVAHALIGEVVTGAIDRPDRRRRHATLAAALRRVGADPGELARHLEAGGDTAAAARAYADATAQRLRRAATAEAVRHAAKGLRLASGGQLRRDLLRLHADALAARGQLTHARAQLREAVRDTTNGPERAGLLTRLSVLSLGADDLHRAEELAELAILEAGDDHAARARALTTAAVVDMNQDRAHRARERSDEALGLYEQLRDPSGVATILDARAMARFLEGDVTGAVDAFHRVACAFEDAGQLLQVITPRSTRGHALVFADRPQDGLADTEAAAQLADALGHAEGQAYAAWHRSEALTGLRRLDEAVATARSAVAVAARIGHRGWTATGYLALGLAHAAAGEDDPAAEAYREALGLTTSLPLFHGWAASRLARLLIRRGRLEEAAPLVELATTAPPALGRYEARLAEAELLAARGDPAAGETARRAFALARGGGHLASARILGELASMDGAHQ